MTRLRRAETVSPAQGEAVGARLRTLRRVLGLRAVDLCRALDIRPSTYSQWEAGQRRPNLDDALALADRFGLTLDWLYRGRLDGLSSDLTARLLRATDEAAQRRAPAAPAMIVGIRATGPAVGWLWETDAQHRFTKFSGYIDGTFAPGLFIGRTRWELFAENADDDFWRGHRADLDARREFQDLRLSAQGEDGRFYEFRVSGTPAFARDGTFLGYRGNGIARVLKVQDTGEEQGNIGSPLPDRAVIR